MPNPLFNLFNQPKNPMVDFMQSFNQLQKSFQGNPQQEVERLMKNGMMSQQQFNQYQQMANQICGLMNKRP